MTVTTTRTVVGMTCEHCVRAVSEEVRGIPGVRNVDIDLASGAVTIESDATIDDAVFAAAVDEAGYEVGS